MKSDLPAADLRGASRLIVDAVTGVTDIVESMHRNISGLAPVVGASREGGTQGITGLVYRSIHGVSRLVGTGLDVALSQLAPLLEGRSPMPQREATVAALNGVLGDYLEASNNPLAISMRLRQDGRPLTLDREALADDVVRPRSKLVVLVHGLCMNDLQWHRDGHDHGAALAEDLGYTPLYLYYNTGRHISTNGRQLAELLEQLTRAWPVPISELVVVGYSMGGLVARSACHYAELAGHGWPSSLAKLVFLGTPHHGAPLERAGNWLDIVVGISPYTAPFARLSKVRSAGLRDLRYGNVVDEDWQGVGTEQVRDSRQPLPLPDGVQCFAIAATRQLESSGDTPLRGDGLVPVNSALGQHEDPVLSLAIDPSCRSIVCGSSHFDLLSSREVAEHIHRWLASSSREEVSSEIV